MNEEINLLETKLNLLVNKIETLQKENLDMKPALHRAEEEVLLLKNKIKSIDKVFYTHLHADQTHGINDLRPFYLINKKQIPVYADNKTSKYLSSIA